MSIRCICAALTGCLALLCGAAGSGASAPQMTRLSAYFPAGDPLRGEILSAGCEPCHGGAAPLLGAPPLHAPKLRHQRASAIFYALQDYKSSRRRNAVMQAIAARLSDQQMRDLSVFLAGDRSPIPKASLTGAHDQAGSLCAFCHGETGLGEMDGVPVLTGQYPDYLQQALADYRSGARADPTMSAIVQEITKEQAADLAQYFAAYAALEPSPAQAPRP